MCGKNRGRIEEVKEAISRKEMHKRRCEGIVLRIIRGGMKV